MTTPSSIALSCLLLFSVSLRADDAAFYREKIHPLLEQHCFKCHGGEEKLKGNFRITSREGLLLGGDYGSGYDTDNPEKSLLLEMVSYQDDDSQMPPKAKLPDADLALLKEWVLKGVPYDPALEIKGVSAEKRGFSVSEEDRNYWAYQVLKATDPPKVDDPAWAKNPVDSFIFSKLDEAGLEPNGPVDGGPLVRRIYYDLIGLPPTRQEVDQFEKAFAANADQAVAALVDELLARPQYGEKWARHWLDVVRYGESNGFERDNSKPEMWRYRDYVISAFNQDKPYDQFVVEQLAGDETAKPTQASLTATGYHRLMQWDDEPADRKQHVYDVLADNVLVTSEAFLGMTIGCARCHDHKVDPISQKDYYSFMAFFHGVTPYQTPGTIRPWASPEELASFEVDRKKLLAPDQAKLKALETKMTDHLKKVGKLERKGDAPEVGIKTFVDDGRKNPATWSFTTAMPAPGWKDVGQVVKGWTKSQGGFGTKGTPNVFVGKEWKTSDIWMRTNFGAQEIPEKLVLEIYHDEDVEVYLNGVEIYKATGYVSDYQTIELGQEALDAFQTGKNVLAAHCHQTGGGQFIDMALRTGALKPNSLTEALHRGGKKLQTSLKKQFGKDIVQEWRDTKNRIEQTHRKVPGTPLNVVQESGTKPLPLHVHLRGSAHAPGDQVEPGFPSVLGEGDESVPAKVEPVENLGVKSSGRRLALAKWMVDPQNPLTARVMVNRVWQHHFGRGIVPSSSDFGKLGEDPTHPELLEYLSYQFIQNGWSLKDLHRRIMLSKTYRMSSAPNEKNLLADPSNLLFWRFNMRRLSAEELRDSMLALSGKLNLKVGGQWVYPPMPDEVLATASQPGKGWPVSEKEEDHYRRSLYIHVKRSLRYQLLADFDQADTDSPCAVRFATTVPTQALTMLNSKFVNDQATLLAQRLRSGSDSSVESQVRSGLELALQREARNDEIQHCVELVEKLKADGMSEEVALERFALVALNLNEFVYLD